MTPTPASAKVRRVCPNLLMRHPLPRLAQLLKDHPRWIAVPAVVAMTLPNPLRAILTRTPTSFCNQRAVPSAQAAVGTAIVDDNDTAWGKCSGVVAGPVVADRTAENSSKWDAGGTPRSATQPFNAGIGLGVRGPPIGY